MAFVACLSVAAQSVAARIASVIGQVAFSGANGAAPLLATPGFELSPGDRVDTRAGGQLTIELTDGSMIVVQPGSLIVIRDFRAAVSLRELFEIMLGTVRVKINHFAGQPNPYRINSPTASIAVRGTEFSVTVDGQGNTKVMVYEGSVEVTSLIDPTQSVVVEAGVGVLQVPGQGFQLFADLPGREIAEQNQPPGRSVGGSTAFSMTNRGGQVDLDAPQNIASIYEQYVAGLSDVGQLPFLLRYNAFPEAHLDTLDNPAYAAGFKSVEARAVFVPTLSGNGGLDENPTPRGLSPVNPVDYGAMSQLSAAVPLPDRFVAGGSITASSVGSGVQAVPSDIGLWSILGQTIPDSSLQTNASSSGRFISGSLFAARSFGANTSVGVEVESLRGTGSLAAQILSGAQPNGPIERLASRSTISQERVTAGIERDLPRGQKLGFFYRYGLIHAADDDLSHTLNNVQEPLDSTRSSGHSSEFGLRLRGPLGRKFFYGAQASWRGLALGGELIRSDVADSLQRDRAHRGSAALGFGYFLNRWTVMSVDFAGGTSLASTDRTEMVTGNLLQTGAQNSRFLSANVGIQAKLSSRLFVNASLLGIWRAYDLDEIAYPDSFGNTTLIEDPFLPLAATGYRPPPRSSDFGAGWRFSSSLLVQYVFSTSYGPDSGSNILMLRYTLQSHVE